MRQELHGADEPFVVQSASSHHPCILQPKLRHKKCGLMGQCASTHNLYAVERPREVRAVWRALLLPSGEEANGPLGAESAGAQHTAAWRASNIGDGFLVPELKDESEASEDDETDNVSNEALCVVGLHGSGDKVSRYLQVAQKVVPSLEVL